MSDSPDPAHHPRQNDHPNISMWLDEQIWGHRIHDQQTPWLLFLEFLGVAEACHREGDLLGPSGHSYPLRFRPNKRMHLRNILFNSEIISEIDKRNPDSSTAWDAWLAWMADNALGVNDTDFRYLRPRFGKFNKFTLVVALLKDSAVEGETNRRWTSRFVFPFGPNALYEDLNITPAGKTSREYNNFGRTGELLYLMLSRADRAAELRPFVQAMLSGTNPLNQILGLLQPAEGHEDISTRGWSYLPYDTHPSFDALAEDWLKVFALSLPSFDVFPHLATLGTIHVLLYQLRVAAEAAGADRPHLVCEVMSPKKTLVREISASNYQENNRLTTRAVEAFIQGIERSAAWTVAVGEPDSFVVAKQVLLDRIWWPREGKYSGPSDPKSLISELRDQALAGHRLHVANVHRLYGRGVGLVSSRGTTRLRYAPGDGLLRTLLIANVDRRMELGEFLERLYTRYGLVFGDREAERSLPRDDFDKDAFQSNARRLEQRLGSLGMLRRLSDACAYVENPFWREAE